MSTRCYLEHFSAAINQNRKEHGKPPLKPKTQTPEVKESKESTTDLDCGDMVRDGYHENHFDTAVCKVCPRLGKCTGNEQQIKTVTRHVWEGDREAVDTHRLTATDRAIRKRRKETIERYFADAKQLHGHRCVRIRGLLRVLEQCLLSAACQNMKKLALLAEREAKKASGGCKTLLCAGQKGYMAILRGIWPI